MAAWHVYILECADGTYYTGVSNDVPARITAHNLGKGAKYTRARLPVRLVHKQRAKSKGSALSREAVIKSLSRSEKIALIKKKPAQ